MENEPLNSIQNLINKLSEKTFIDNINDLLRNEATNNLILMVKKIQRITILS